MTDTTGHSESAAASDAVLIERTLDAPIDRVWAMWTEAEHFAAWYGPTGARIPTAEMDVRVGGERRVCMEMDTPDGTMQMWFTGEYLEIDPPNRLVYTEAAPGPDGEPFVTEVRVELTASGATTRMVLTHVGVPADSPGATGWNMALDELERRLSS